MTWTRSKVLEENQMMSIISSACGEYFFYGKATYIKKCKMFRKIISEMGWDYMITPTTFNSWQKMKERFADSSKRIGFPIDITYDCTDESDDDFDFVQS
jgi:hypothetical protein